jgi:hypothetical protein
MVKYILFTKKTRFDLLNDFQRGGPDTATYL